MQHPENYTDIAASLADFPNQARPLADDLRTKIAEPTLDAAALFNQHSTMTRLYSTLSPEDMNKIRCSASPSLPPYPNEHPPPLTYHCGGFSRRSAIAPATCWSCPRACTASFHRSGKRRHLPGDRCAV